MKDFLQRNLYSCPPLFKSNCYKALILYYAAVIWAPHDHIQKESDIMALERVQRKMQLALFIIITPTMTVSVRC